APRRRPSATPCTAPWTLRRCVPHPRPPRPSAPRASRPAVKTSRGLSLSSCLGWLGLAVSPGGCLVVKGSGLEASVQDADEAVGEPLRCVVVRESLGAVL